MVRDGRIAEIVARGAGRGDRVYDLSAVTVLPGYIDTHVHIGNHFDDDGKVHREENDPSVAHVTLHGAENAYRTLMNGITTMQSLGSPRDAELRAWIDRGEVPGPRLLSSLGTVREDTGTPDEIRAYVRDRAAAGADVRRGVHPGGARLAARTGGRRRVRRERSSGRRRPPPG